MARLQIVLDTNVLVSGLRSSKGASHRLLRLIGGEKFQLVISVPLILEYEAVAKRLTPLSGRDVDSVIGYICCVSCPRQLHYLWRPALSDPEDDMALELAVAGECPLIVTHNKTDFAEARRFGIRALTPREFLREIGELP